MDVETRRAALTDLLRSAVAAVAPEALTKEAIEASGPATIVAIGKAAAAMCRGAAEAIRDTRGVCVTDAADSVPERIDLMIGDHPIPGERSFRAGQRALDTAAGATDRVVALISGGGSALCEHPLDGIAPEFIQNVTRRLLASGAPIDQVNLVRRHISAVKNGGLAARASVPVDTYVISDVRGADPAVVASGPTIHIQRDPEAAISVLLDHDIEVPLLVESAIRDHPDVAPPDGEVTVLADARGATDAVRRQAEANGWEATTIDAWIRGDVSEALERFLESSGPGITVGAGEPNVAVTGSGRGGRNTHAALLAAILLAGTDAVFAAFATDGVDGTSDSAGAIVDGETTSRGGDPREAIDRADSASYLARTGDLLVTGPTGTNVSDLWVVWL